MPGPWRRRVYILLARCFRCFNLNRDARPLATSWNVQVSQPDLYVSISTEMPGPWRLQCDREPVALVACFNLNREGRKKFLTSKRSKHVTPSGLDSRRT